MDINVPIEFVVEVCGARNVAVLHRGGTEPAWRTGRFRRFSIRKRTARWVPDNPSIERYVDIVRKTSGIRQIVRASELDGLFGHERRSAFA
jgi:hypothetical protein